MLSLDFPCRIAAAIGCHARDMRKFLYLFAAIAALGAVGAVTFPRVTSHALAAKPLTITVKGQQRSYILARPNRSGPQPTMIVLHGLGGNAEALAQGSGLAHLGAREGFVAVFPDGINGWNHLPPGKTPPAYIRLLKWEGLTLPDDVAFLKMLVADLVRREISDPKRIYLVGFSAGGFMTLRMACVVPQMFAAVALIASGMPAVTGDECHPAKPIPVIMIQGTADSAVPWEGGLVSTRAFTVWPQERLFAFLRRLNGCAETSEQSVLPNQNPHKVELVRWSNCSSGGPVVLYRVIGGGHQFPAFPPAGPTLWTFFQDKSR